MRMIRSTHEAIQSRIGDMQTRTASLLKEQRVNITRNFQIKLNETLQASQSGKNEPEHSAEEWAARFREAQAHLMSTETAWKDCDRKNKLLDEENKQLRTQYRAQENDREFLVRQHVSVKRDNARLHDELNRLNAKSRAAAALRQSVDGQSVADSTAGLSTGGGGGGGGGDAAFHTRGAGGAGGASGARYRETITRMRKLLEKERAALRQVRAGFATSMQRRTELASIFFGGPSKTKSPEMGVP